MVPPPKLDGTRLRHALVADGCIITGAEIERSIVGVRGVVHAGCEIRDSILMGYDHYCPGDPELPGARSPSSSCLLLGVGRGCRIEGAIIDKNAAIGEGTTIIGRPGSGVDADTHTYHIRDGFVIVPRDQALPPATEIRV